MYHYKLNNSYTVYVNWSYYSAAVNFEDRATLNTPGGNRQLDRATVTP